MGHRDDNTTRHDTPSYKCRRGRPTRNETQQSTMPWVQYIQRETHQHINDRSSFLRLLVVPSLLRTLLLNLPLSSYKAKGKTPRHSRQVSDITKTKKSSLLARSIRIRRRAEHGHLDHTIWYADPNNQQQNCPPRRNQNWEAGPVDWGA